MAMIIPPFNGNGQIGILVQDSRREI